MYQSPKDYPHDFKIQAVKRYLENGKRGKFTAREFNPKKVNRHFHKGLATKIGKYQFIKDNEPCFTVVKMCQALEVSRSGYYNWKHRKLNKRKSFNILVISEIKRIHLESGEVYGSPKIHKALLSKGYLSLNRLKQNL